MEFTALSRKFLSIWWKREADIVGTPDDCIETIKRLDERSGGFGGFLRGSPRTSLPETKCCAVTSSMARYVMPHFQGSRPALPR